MFKQLSDMANLMKQAKDIGGRMQSMQAELRDQHVSGQSGAGMVAVEVNGLGEVLSIKIDEQLDREMLEDLIPAAVNDALAKSKKLHAEAMQSLTGDVSLPGLDKALNEFTNPKPGN